MVDPCPAGGPFARCGRVLRSLAWTQFLGIPLAPAARFEALRLEARALRRRSVVVRARARATREQILRGRSRRQVLHDSEFARLAAKHDTMPVSAPAVGGFLADFERPH